MAAATRLGDSVTVDRASEVLPSPKTGERRDRAMNRVTADTAHTGSAVRAGIESGVFRIMATLTPGYDLAGRSGVAESENGSYSTTLEKVVLGPSVTGLATGGRGIQAARSNGVEGRMRVSREDGDDFIVAIGADGRACGGRLLCRSSCDRGQTQDHCGQQRNQPGPRTRGHYVAAIPTALRAASRCRILPKHPHKLRRGLEIGRITGCPRSVACQSS